MHLSHVLTLLLGACFTSLEVEVADHVVDNALPPLEGDDHCIVFVAPLELIRTHKDLHLLLIQDLNGVGGILKPPYWSRILLLVNETCKHEVFLTAGFGRHHVKSFTQFFC